MPEEIPSIPTITVEHPIPEDLVGITTEQLQARVAESELNMLRQHRNAKLAACDWVAAKAVDTGVGISSEWSTYRQALRDITDTYQSIDAEGFAWPTKPSS